MAKRGDLAFIITQGYRNIAVLYQIKDMIGFGSVHKQGARTFRYVVQDEEGLGNIIEMLNGNVVLGKRRIVLERFIAAYNERYSKSIEVKTTKVLPTLKDG